MTDRHLWLVNNDLPADVADEYNCWYLEVHIPQVLDVPGFVSGERFELASAQHRGVQPELRRYLSVFEIEGDPEAAFAALGAARAAGKLDPSPVEGSVASTANFVPLGPRQTS